MTERVSKQQWIENKKAEKKVLENKLDGFLKESLSSKGDMDKLTAHYKISGLYTHSFKNCILIHIQGGTIAQGFHRWKKSKRFVSKGEKSFIQVFAPIFKKERDELTGEVDEKLIGYKLVPVFDIKQTEGKDLEYDHNSKGVADYKGIKSVLEELSGVKVVEEFTGSARGYSDGKKMAVSKMSNDVDKTKTLIHEYAHHVLHQNENKTNLSREAKEVEAESVAHLVCSYIGVDYSLSKEYVSNYKTGIADIRSSKVVKCAEKVIKEIRKTEK